MSLEHPAKGPSGVSGVSEVARTPLERRCAKLRLGYPLESVVPREPSSAPDWERAQFVRHGAMTQAAMRGYYQLLCPFEVALNAVMCSI